MNKALIIFGAGSQAREVAEYLKQNGESVQKFIIDRDYASDIEPELKDMLLYSDAAGDISNVPGILGIGFPGAKKMVADKWPRQIYGRVLSNAAWIASNASISEGCIVAPLSVINANVRLGKHVLVNIGATVSHDCVVGDYSSISPGCHIAGNVRIGDGVFIGIGANIIQGITIGEGSLIAAGATVIRDVPPHTMVAGVPAKEMRNQPEWP